MIGTALRVLGSRIRGVFRRGRRDDQLSDEIRAHLDLLAAEHMQRGLSAVAARAAARRDFGGVDQIKEAYRARRGLPALETVGQDVRYALRSFRKTPAVAVTIVLVLTLAIGATTTVFSVLNALAFRLLPVPRPQELYLVEQAGPGSVPFRFSFPSFERVRDGVGGTLAVAAMSRIQLVETSIDGHRLDARRRVQLVSGEYFDVIGSPPILGRALSADDNRFAGRRPVAVISEAMWRRVFLASRDVVGRDLMLNGAPVRIVGVAPAGFSGVWLEAPADIWIPLAMQDEVRYAQNYSAHDGDDLKPWPPQDSIEWLQIVARVSSPQMAVVQGPLSNVFAGEMARLAESYTGAFRQQLLRRRVALTPVARGLSTERTRLTNPLVALLAMVTVVLIIACANAANLLLARAAARRRELAIRLSMGASRGRLARQLITEGVLLVAAASTLGVLLAYWGGDDLARRLLGEAPGREPFRSLVDGRVLGFASLASTITVLLFGLLPAWRATADRSADVLRSDSRTMREGARLTSSKLLVSGQIALSLALVTAAGLFGQSLLALTRVPLGYDPARVVTVKFNARASRYTERDLRELYRSLVRRVEGLPGVQSAAVSTCPLAAGCRDSTTVTIAGYVPRPDEEIRFGEYSVGPRYFSTVGMRLVSGRAFDDRDTDRTPLVAIVNETAERLYFDGRSVLGQSFSFGDQRIEIVGVVADARVNAVQESPGPMAYYPLAQRPTRFASALEIRMSGVPASILDEVRRSIHDAAPTLLVDSVTATARQVDDNLRRERVVAQVTASLGLMALALASFGLFGVMSYNVAQRSGELGVRLALGATPSRVLTMVLGESLRLAVIGVALGVPAVLASARLVSSLLVGVAPTDPLTIAMSATVLVGAATIAGLLPAWRASRVDPAVTLRWE